MLPIWQGKMAVLRHGKAKNIRAVLEWITNICGSLPVRMPCILPCVLPCVLPWKCSKNGITEWSWSRQPCSQRHWSASYISIMSCLFLKCCDHGFPHLDGSIFMFFPYRWGVWTSSIVWTHHDRSHESVDPVDAFFLLGSNGVIPMGVPMEVPLYRWMFFCWWNMHENAINVGIPLRKPPYVKRQKVICIYIYICICHQLKDWFESEVFHLVSTILVREYTSVISPYPRFHQAVSNQDVPFVDFPANRKPQTLAFLVLISYSACVYIYIHDVCSVRQCNRMKCKYDSMYVSSLTFSRIEPWSFSPSQRANMWSSRRRTPARPPAPARKTTLGTHWIPWRCRMWSWPLTHATWRSILAKNVLMSVYKR